MFPQNCVYACFNFCYHNELDVRAYKSLGNLRCKNLIRNLLNLASISKIVFKIALLGGIFQANGVNRNTFKYSTNS